MYLYSEINIKKQKRAAATINRGKKQANGDDFEFDVILAETRVEDAAAANETTAVDENEVLAVAEEKLEGGTDKTASFLAEQGLLATENTATAKKKERKKEVAVKRRMMAR